VTVRSLPSEVVVALMPEAPSRHLDALVGDTGSARAGCVARGITLDAELFDGRAGNDVGRDVWNDLVAMVSLDAGVFAFTPSAIQWPARTIEASKAAARNHVSTEKRRDVANYSLEAGRPEGYVLDGEIRPSFFAHTGERGENAGVLGAFLSRGRGRLLNGGVCDLALGRIAVRARVYAGGVAETSSVKVTFDR
jgi:hypothetical protein